jgi:hypothetical protein
VVNDDGDRNAATARQHPSREAHLATRATRGNNFSKVLSYLWFTSTTSVPNKLKKTFHCQDLKL